MTKSSNLAKLYLNNCVGCGSCVEICTLYAIPNTLIGFISSLARVNEQKCNGCGDCVNICSHEAITMVDRESE
jgi:ferredoxin